MLGGQTRSFSPGEVPVDTPRLSVCQRMQLVGMQQPLLCSGGQPADACCKLHVAMLLEFASGPVSKLAWQTHVLSADRNATEGLNLVANTWGRANLKPGDEASLQNPKLHCLCTACDTAMQYTS